MWRASNRLSTFTQQNRHEKTARLFLYLRPSLGIRKTPIYAVGLKAIKDAVQEAGNSVVELQKEHEQNGGGNGDDYQEKKGALERLHAIC